MHTPANSRGRLDSQAHLTAGGTASTSGVIMLIGLFGLLVIVTFYLAKRLSDEKTENAALRDRIASLKRQLARRSRTPVGA